MWGKFEIRLGMKWPGFMRVDGKHLCIILFDWIVDVFVLHVTKVSWIAVSFALFSVSAVIQYF